MRLNSRLIISYVLLAAFLSLSTLLVSKYFLGSQFQAYASHKQDMRNEEILGMVASIFTDGGADGGAKMSLISNLSDSLLKQGAVLMLYDAEDRLIFCSSMENEDACRHIQYSSGAGAIGAGASVRENCPACGEAFTSQRYEISHGGVRRGYALLGYSSPPRYDEGDRVFVDGFNRAFLIMTAVFFAAAVALGLFMAAKISGPIQRVILRTKSVSGGEYAGRVGIVTGTVEIDELSKSVDHLAESLQTQFTLKKRMASAYSHEFRTPLTSLQTNIEAMLDGIWQPTPERLESLLSETHRLSRMVSGIENLALAQVKETDISAADAADISQICERITRGFEPEAKRKNITLKFEKKPCAARVDPDKFSQVAVNLISNAIKYTNDGGNILVKTCQNSAGHAVFSVEDDGIGIAENDLQYIFEYLYRTDESRTRGSGGSGVGLSVVKAVVEAHGGSINVKSSPGAGSIFTAEFPA